MNNESLINTASTDRTACRAQVERWAKRMYWIKQTASSSNIRVPHERKRSCENFMILYSRNPSHRVAKFIHSYLHRIFRSSLFQTKFRFAKKSALCQHIFVNPDFRSNWWYREFPGTLTRRRDSKVTPRTKRSHNVVREQTASLESPLECVWHMVMEEPWDEAWSFSFIPQRLDWGPPLPELWLCLVEPSVGSNRHWVAEHHQMQQSAYTVGVSCSPLLWMPVTYSVIPKYELL